ncbi:hypothetical protein T02_3058 [Trichinella nativa]|uniref:Uncharacterized protein n=1 Tax=Trichinella nativa TaxID=6335 RepID=A0A0V1LDB0_9BILA|nr:hypothetical protein T02_3058 [Trichinella nativa]
MTNFLSTITLPLHLANVLGRMDNMYNRISEWALSGFSNGSSGSLIALFYPETGRSKNIAAQKFRQSFLFSSIHSLASPYYLALNACFQNFVVVNMRKCCIIVYCVAFIQKWLYLIHFTSNTFIEGNQYIIIALFLFTSKKAKRTEIVNGIRFNGVSFREIVLGIIIALFYLAIAIDHIACHARLSMTCINL